MVWNVVNWLKEKHLNATSGAFSLSKNLTALALRQDHYLKTIKRFEWFLNLFRAEIYGAKMRSELI